MWKWEIGEKEMKEVMGISGIVKWCDSDIGIVIKVVWNCW